MLLKDCVRGSVTTCPSGDRASGVRRGSWEQFFPPHHRKPGPEVEAVLVLRPAYGIKGALKTARKGWANTPSQWPEGSALRAGFREGERNCRNGKANHRYRQTGGPERGLTLNVGLVSGGTRTNVIPAQATASLDVRVARLKDVPGIDRQLKALKPFNRKCKLEIAGGVNRPPWNGVRGSRVVQEGFRDRKQLGWNLEEASVGGGSDGNFTASLGIPTLDGLGGVGEAPTPPMSPSSSLNCRAGQRYWHS